MGRPDKLTKKAQEVIVERISAGVPYKWAVAATDVSMGTFERWMARGAKEKSGKYRRFREAVEKAKADCVAARVAHILKAGQAAQQWTANAWWLERVCHEEFSSKQKVEHSGPEGKPIEQRIKIIRERNWRGGSTEA